MCSSFDLDDDFFILELQFMTSSIREEIQLDFFIFVSTSGPSRCFFALKLIVLRNDALSVEKLDEGVKGLIFVGNVNLMIHQYKR